MSATLHLAGPDDLPKLTKLVAAFHAEHAIEMDPLKRETVLKPICDGIPQAVAYLVGPKVSPLGYVILTIGYSVEFGGYDSWLDEIYVRPNVRGRGIGGEVLLQLGKTMSEAGVKAMFLEADPQNESALRLYQRSGFQPRDRYQTLVKPL